MKKNGKYFVAPQKGEDSFKRLFARLAAEGAGRPADQYGFADGPWTPETLTQAICDLHGNDKGIDLRTVQVWFQANDNGISMENIRWLTRIFGCDDPEFSSMWQKELIGSKDRLTAERRAKKQAIAEAKNIAPNHDNKLVEELTKSELAAFPPRRTCVDHINYMITNSNNLYLVILVWAGWAVVAVSATILGLSHVTYPLIDGTEKDVGFYLTPAWTAEKIILIPVFILITSRAVMTWLAYRASLPDGSMRKSWSARLKDYRVAFYAINAVCILIVFGMQWYGSYLQPLLAGPMSEVTPNWLRVTTNPVPLAPLWVIVGLSLFVGLYIGTIYWLCFSALLLLFIAAHDFIANNSNTAQAMSRPARTRKVEVGQDLIVALYRIAVCGILMSMMIKVSVVYLDVDSPTFISWIVRDFLSGLGLQTASWSWNGGTQLATATSGMFLFVVAAVAFLGIYWIKATIEKPEKAPFVSQTRLLSAPLFMILGFQVVGEFNGFSIIFCLGVLIGIWQLLRPSLKFTVY